MYFKNLKNVLIPKAPKQKKGLGQLKESLKKLRQKNSVFFAFDELERVPELILV